MMQSANGAQCEECGTHLYQAGERVPAGTYLRVDDGSFHRLRLSAEGPLPASFDGHVALYRAAAPLCVCERRHAEAVHAVTTRTAAARGESVMPALVETGAAGS